MPPIKHPRDLYAELQSIWISRPTYLLKRLQLEQHIIEHCNIRDLAVAHLFMKYEIARISRQLRDLKAIETITQQVIDDLEIDAQCQKQEQND